MKFQLEVDLDFSLGMFKLTFIHSIHLSTKEPLSMIFKHLWDLFDSEDSVNNFSQLFFVCFYVVVGCIPESITKALNVAKLLVLTKFFGGIQLIMVSEVFYQLVSKTFCF